MGWQILFVNIGHSLYSVGSDVIVDLCQALFLSTEPPCPNVIASPISSTAAVAD